MIFGTRRRRRRRELYDAGFTDDWRQLCRDRLDWWAVLAPDERERVELVALGLIARADWEPANGFEVTEDMQVLIAAQAALLTANLPYEDPYRDVHAVIVHPTTTIMHGEHSQVDGIYSDDPTPVLGEAMMHGPLLVAWDEVQDDVHHAGDGRNVVFHEFAHKLDMLNGPPDGLPPLHEGMNRQAWIDAFEPAYADFCARVDDGEATHIDPYAAEHPAEFFAVTSEVFFEAPDLLHREYPAVYEQLRQFYRQDPLR